jgi:predicted HicB family RNase H-like nuclease
LPIALLLVSIYNEALKGDFYMATSDAQRKSNKKYDAEHFEYFTVKGKKGMRETLKTVATARGESLNGFITRVLNEAIERDLTPSADP